MGYAFKTPIGDGAMDALGYFVREFLYANFREDRQDIELKWQNNLDTFNSELEYTWKEEEGEDWRSKTRLQVARIKILSAWAIIIDLALQNGDIRFSLLPSPYDEVNFETLDDASQSEIRGEIEKMEMKIRQQLADCNADRQLMRAVLSQALYGETIGKCYVHEVQRTGYAPVNMLEPYGIDDLTGEYTRWQQTIQEIIQPAWETLSVWDVFRDLETDNLQEGQGIIHRQMVSAFHLRQKMGKPYYLDEEIELAISEAAEPGSSQHGSEDVNTLPPGLRDIKHRHKTVEQLEFWGRVPETIAAEFERQHGLDGGFPKEKPLASPITIHEWDGNEVEIMCVMADNHVIRYARVPEKSRPFNRSVWEINLEGNYGKGVADSLKDITTVIDGMIRCFEDNKRLSANVILALKERLIGAWDGKIKPGCKIDIADECDDARKAVQQIVIQDVGDAILSGFALFERLADESTMIPKILQGETQEKKKPDTAFEMSQLIQYSSKTLGAVVKNLDEGTIEPTVQWMYEWNMDDPEVAEGKGNYIAKAMGYASFQDKIVRVQVLQQFLALVLSSPRLTSEVKLRTVLEAIASAMDLDINRFLLSEEEKNMIAQQEREALIAQEEEARNARLQEAEDMEVAKSGAAAASAEEQHQRNLEMEQVKAMTAQSANQGAA